MILPTPQSLCGQLLLAMLDGKARSKIELAQAINKNIATEVTARVRELRGMGYPIPQRETEKRGEHNCYVYRLEGLSGPVALQIRLNHIMHNFLGLTIPEAAKKLSANRVEVALQMAAMERAGYIAQAETRNCSVTQKARETYWPAATVAAVKKERAA